MMYLSPGWLQIRYKSDAYLRNIFLLIYMCYPKWIKIKRLFYICTWITAANTSILAVIIQNILIHVYLLHIKILQRHGTCTPFSQRAVASQRIFDHLKHILMSSFLIVSKEAVLLWNSFGTFNRANYTYITNNLKIPTNLPKSIYMKNL